MKKFCLHITNYLLLVSIFAPLDCRRHKKRIAAAPFEILVATIPKSGTNLLGTIIQKIGNYTWEQSLLNTQVDPLKILHLTGQDMYITHAPCVDYNYDEALKHKLKVIFLMRDPRDVMVSYAYWIQKNKSIWKEYAHLSLEEIITSLIQFFPWPRATNLSYENWLMNYCEPWSGFNGIPCSEVINIVQNRYDAQKGELTTITDFYNFYLPWQHYPHCYVTSFEKLIGPKGGGNKEIQENEILNIAQFLTRPLTKAQAEFISSGLFGSSSTFREGFIGSWRKKMTSKQVQDLNNVKGFNDLLILLGYEKDENW